MVPSIMASPGWYGQGRPTRGEPGAAVGHVVVVASGVEEPSSPPPGVTSTFVPMMRLPCTTMTGVSGVSAGVAGV
jgi:hypothetical protein